MSKVLINIITKILISIWDHRLTFLGFYALKTLKPMP